MEKLNEIVDRSTVRSRNIFHTNNYMIRLMFEIFKRRAGRRIIGQWTNIIFGIIILQLGIYLVFNQHHIFTFHSVENIF